MLHHESLFNTMLCCVIIDANIKLQKKGRFRLIFKECVMLELIFELPKFILVLMLSFIAMIFLIGAFKIFLADQATYKCNHRSTSGFLHAIKGTVPTNREGARSHNIVAGLVYDLKHKKVVPQGTLSNEAIENLLR